jgi:hypothetical protein
MRKTALRHKAFTAVPRKTRSPDPPPRPATCTRRSLPARSHRFYRDTLGRAIYREFGSPDAPGLVFFLGNGSRGQRSDDGPARRRDLVVDADPR